MVFLRHWVGKDRVTLHECDFNRRRVGRVTFDDLDSVGKDATLGNGTNRRYWFVEEGTNKHDRLYAHGPYRVIALDHNTLYVLPRNSPID